MTKTSKLKKHRYVFYGFIFGLILGLLLYMGAYQAVVNVVISDQQAPTPGLICLAQGNMDVQVPCPTKIIFHTASPSASK